MVASADKKVKLESLFPVVRQKKTYIPRSYQQEAVNALVDQYEGGYDALHHRWSGAILIGTGGGKTWVGVETLHVLWKRNPLLRVLFLAHRDYLLDQARDTFLDVCPQQVQKSIAYSDESEIAVSSSKLVFSTWPALYTRATLEKLQKERFDVVVIDEGHHSVAPTYYDVLQAFSVNTPDGPFILGMSATWIHETGDLVSLFGKTPVFTKTVHSLVQEGYLVPPVFIAVHAQINFSSAQKEIVQGADQGYEVAYKEQDMTRIAASPSNIELAVRTVQDTWKSYPENTHTLLVAASCKHGLLLQKALSQAGIKAFYVDGKMAKKEYDTVMQEYSLYEDHVVMITITKLTEGYDNPKIDSVIIARPTESRSLAMQMIGRGMRLYKDKGKCVVVLMTNKFPILKGMDRISNGNGKKKKGKPPQGKDEAQNVAIEVADERILTDKDGLLFIPLDIFDELEDSEEDDTRDEITVYLDNLEEEAGETEDDTQEPQEKKNSVRFSRVGPKEAIVAVCVDEENRYYNVQHFKMKSSKALESSPDSPWDVRVYHTPPMGIAVVSAFIKRLTSDREGADKDQKRYAARIFTAAYERPSTLRQIDYLRYVLARQVLERSQARGFTGHQLPASILDKVSQVDCCGKASDMIRYFKAWLESTEEKEKEQ